MRISEDDSSWRAGGVVRRDFRHSHDGPEVPKHAGAKKKKFKKCKGKGAHDWHDMNDDWRGYRQCSICGKKKDFTYNWKAYMGRRNY